jgi:hypothetical protein
MDFDDFINEKDSSTEDPLELRAVKKKIKKRGRKPKMDAPLLERKSDLTEYIEENSAYVKSYKT